MSTTFFVIVNYNSGSRLIPCIQSIFAAKNMLNPSQIIVIDNASRDQSREICKAKYPRLTYIYNSDNLGFGAGANIGIRRAIEKGAQQIILVNPDALLDPSCVQEMERALSDSTIGIVSPTVYTLEEKPRIWFSGGIIDHWKQRVLHVTSPLAPSVTRETPFVSGCVMGFRADFIHDVGLFDERFFLYYEDADLSTRSTEAGKTNLVLRNARAYHEEQSEELGDIKLYHLVLSGALYFNLHARGILRLWFPLYMTIRKSHAYKNRILRKPSSQIISYALTDYTDAKKSTHFIPDRQL